MELNAEIYTYEQFCVAQLLWGKKGENDVRVPNELEGFAFPPDLYAPNGILALGLEGKTVIEVKKLLSYATVKEMNALYETHGTNYNVLVVYFSKSISRVPEEMKEQGKTIKYISLLDLKRIYKKKSEINKEDYYAKKAKKNDWITDRKETINRAQEAISQGNCVMFLGAGVSMSAKLPSWNDLLKGLMGEVKQLRVSTLEAFKELAIFATLTTVLLPTACTSHLDEHDLTGVWMREQEVLPDSSIVTYPNEMGQSFYKVYSDDGTYYLVYMLQQGDKEYLLPLPTATWEVRDGLYIERGDTMDATIHSADSMTVHWHGITETWRRITDSERDHIVEVSRMEMIQQAKERDNIAEVSRMEKIQQAKDMEAFLMALSRKEYAWRMELLWWTIGAVVIIALSFGVYGWLMRRKKKEIEQRLHEIEQRNQLTPKKVADARAEVAADFFNSDYYVSLRQRIQDAGRLSTDEWQKMEEALRPVYPDFATTLRSFRLSDVEYQVSLLLKLRIPLKDISTVMYKDATTISSIRSRLYQKVFQKKGGSRDWDDFIATL